MAHADPTHVTLDEWIAREAVAFSADSPGALDAAVDRMIAAVGDRVELLGVGEALHGGEDVLVLRNRVFERLVAAHGFSAIAVESSFPRSTLVNRYVRADEGGGGGARSGGGEGDARRDTGAGTDAGGTGPASYEAVREAGFSHGFGALEANRELVEWMRRYNADPARRGPKLRFYGFDSPTEMTGTESPRQLLRFVLDYLDAVNGDGTAAEAHRAERRRRIEGHLGPDAAWEDPAAMMDPAKSIGLSPAAAALRIEADDLVTELRLRRPELAARGVDDAPGNGGDADEDANDHGAAADRYLEALQHAAMARGMLSYHAGMARSSANRVAELLGMRDLMMADCLAAIIERERRRGRGGKVLAFAHNSHLQRGRAAWQLGPHALAWWPAGAHLDARLGARYAVVGTAIGASAANGIGAPEAGTLEARLMATPGPARFIPTHRGRGLSPEALAGLATRSPSARNGTYFPLTARSLRDFDALLVLDSTAYTRGGPPLP